MTELITIPIPAHLKHPFYFGDSEVVELNVSAFQEWNSLAVEELGYELLASIGHLGYQPWIDSGEIVSLLCNEWKRLEVNLEELYKKRAVKEAEPLMKRGIKLCIATLFWHNEHPISFNRWENMNEFLPSVPVNFSERMSFIMTRPSLYASFKVLSQIMIELQKLIAIDQIKRKRRQKN